MGKTKRQALPPIVATWRARARERKEREVGSLTSYGGKGEGGVSFQLPPGWGKGIKGVRHRPDNVKHPGRVYWTSRREARELAKVMSDVQGKHVEFDP